MKNKKNKVNQFLEIPLEMYTDVLKITILGFNEMLIENHKGIVEYQEMYIRIKTSKGILDIVGKNLHLNEMRSEDILITGNIEKIDYQQLIDERNFK